MRKKGNNNNKKKMIPSTIILLLIINMITPIVLGASYLSNESINETKGFWRDVFVDDSMISNMSDITLFDGEAKITGPGFNFFFNSYEITPSKTKSWQTIDVSELIPRGSTGVILELVNTHKWLNREIAVRMSASLDAFKYSKIKSKGHVYALCGVNDNRKFEAYISSDKCKIYMTGYTDSAVNFFQNRIDKSLKTADKWTEIDLSSDIPDDATGVIFQIINTKRNKILGNNNQKASIRNLGSYDKVLNTDILEGGGRIYALCGVNDKKIEAFIESGGVGKLKHYLVGYTTHPIQFLDNQVDVELNKANAWQNLNIKSMTSNTTNGLIFRISNSDSKIIFSAHTAMIRPVDSIDDRGDMCNIIGDGHIWGIVAANKNQQFEIKGDSKITFNLMGYSKAITSGIIYSKAIIPSILKKWNSFSWNDVESRNTDIKYQVEYFQNGKWSLIPDSDLSKNSEGFDDSPIDLTDLSVKKYKSIRLKAKLSTLDITVTPKIKDWGVTWQTDTNEWSDDFSTDYKIKSSENTNANLGMTLGINHSDWTTYGGNDYRTGVSELNIGPTTNNVLWKANVTGTWDCYAGATIHDGVVYVVGKDWKTGEDKQGNLLHRPGHAYTTALDAATGEKLWMFPTGSVDDNPVYYDGMIFVQSSRYRRSMNDYTGGYDRLWCLDAIDGSLIWEFVQDDCTTDDFNCMCGIPTIAEDKNLVMTTNNNILYAVYITTGEKAWSERLPNAKKTPTAPTYHNGVVYAACESKNNMGDWLYAFDVYKDHGELKWSTGGTNRVLTGNVGVHDSSPAIYNYNGEDRLYIGVMDGTLHEINLETGEDIRVIDFGIFNGLLGTPTIHDDIVYIGGNGGYMFAVKLSDFSVKWRKSFYDYGVFERFKDGAMMNYAIFSTAAVANGIVYYGSLDNTIYALSESDGNIVWTYKTGNYVFGQAAIADGVLYLTSDDWYLYAFGPESGPVYRYYQSGTVKSTKITKSDSMDWNKFRATDAIITGTDIKYKILDENENEICEVKDGDDISHISQNTIILSAALSSDNNEKTPILYDWKVTTKPGEESFGSITVLLICIILAVILGFVYIRYFKK